MASRTPVLEALDLQIEYATQTGPVRSLDGATLALGADGTTALVGESGSGKTTLALAAGRLLAANASHVGGDIRIMGTSILSADPETVRALRRDALGYIFQDPVAALDPTMRVQRQLELAMDGPARPRQAVEAVQAVGLPDPERVLRAFPHELSGGMAQRVGIALALLRSPRLLIADEPTAAVDATRREQLLQLLVSRCRDHGCGLLLLTHDLHTVAKWCTRVAVMYAGRIVECGPTRDVLSAPMHPYTRALVQALPGDEELGERLQPIPGRPPVLHGPSEGCAFAPRCEHAFSPCTSVRPGETGVGTRDVCCHLFGADVVELHQVGTANASDAKERVPRFAARSARWDGVLE